MSKSFCVFVDEMYYVDFVALYNSWKYYEHKTPLKVYSHNNLSKEKIENIKKVCEVIEVSNPNISPEVYFGKQVFKYMAMLDNMDEYQILLDADTLFLSNTDFLFDIIEEGKIIGSTEFDNEYSTEAYYKNTDDFFYDKHLLQTHLGEDIIKEFNLKFTNKVFNGGLLGFNKSKHKFLLQKTVDILCDKSISHKNPIFQNEQFMVNFLIKLFDLPTYELPRNSWMNTWWNHKTPKKIIKIENGKFCVYDDEGTKLNFYHFTGDIGMQYAGDGNIYTCRPHQLFGNVYYEPQFTKNDVEQLWYGRHENPVLLLFEHFYNKGI